MVKEPIELVGGLEVKGSGNNALYNYTIPELSLDFSIRGEWENEAFLKLIKKLNENLSHNPAKNEPKHSRKRARPALLRGRKRR